MWENKRENKNVGEIEREEKNNTCQNMREEENLFRERVRRE